MKTLLLFLFTCATTFAQEFTVTKEGKLMSKKDGKADYVIANSPGISADTLYASAKKYVQSKSGSGQVMIKNDDAGKILVFDIADAPVSTLKKNGQDVAYTASYTTSLEFKDGRTRISYGNINIYTATGTEAKTSYPLTAVYSSTGKVADKEAKNLIESYFTANAKALTAALKSDGKASAGSW